MSKKINYLGGKYWSDIVIGNVIANEFDLNNAVKKMVLKRESLCGCGKYGTRIIFQHEGQIYAFDFLTGYPCECNK